MLFWLNTYKAILPDKAYQGEDLIDTDEIQSVYYS
jgi:hypothetical protein